MKTIIAFGDSITHGHTLVTEKRWVTLLGTLMRERYGDNAPVLINAGVGGNTSAEGLMRIEADVLAHLPGIVLVEFGGNDPTHMDGRHVSVEAYAENIRDINRQVTTHGGTVILLTFPPVINEWHAARADPYFDTWSGLDACVEQYREKTRELASELSLPLFDLDNLLRRAIAEKDAATVVMPDGIHLTEQGNILVARAIFDFLVARFIPCENY